MPAAAAAIRVYGELPFGSAVTIEGLTAVGFLTEVFLDSVHLFNGATVTVRDNEFDHCAGGRGPTPIDWDTETLSFAVRSSSRIGALIGGRH